MQNDQLAFCAAVIAGGIATSHHNDAPDGIARRAIEIARAIHEQIEPPEPESGAAELTAAEEPDPLTEAPPLDKPRSSMVPG